MVGDDESAAEHSLHVGEAADKLDGSRQLAGQYDVAITVEMPDGDAMTKLSIALTSRGFVRTTTVRAFTPEEFGKLATEAP